MTSLTDCRPQKGSTHGGIYVTFKHHFFQKQGGISTLSKAKTSLDISKENVFGHYNNNVHSRLRWFFRDKLVQDSCESQVKRPVVLTIASSSTGLSYQNRKTGQWSRFSPNVANTHSRPPPPPPLSLTHTHSRPPLSLSHTHTLAPPPLSLSHTHTYTCRQAGKQAGRQTDKQAGKASKQTNKQAGKQAGKQTYKQAGKQADRQRGLLTV